MRMKLILLMVFLGLIFFPLALAAQTDRVCEFVPGATLTPVPGSDIPLRQVTYTTSINLPKFDPGLGQLTKVHLTVDACGKQDFAIDNEDPGEGPFNFDLTHSGLIRVTVPVTIPEIVDVVVTDTTSIALPTDSDGLPDFLGDDSYSNTIQDCSDAPLDKEYTQPSDLAVFTASSAGNTEFVNLPVSASGSMEIVTDSGNAASSFATFMGAKACVVYEYLVPLCINGTKINECTGEGIPGWEICLTDSNGQKFCTTTDSNGDYSFCGLLPGDYEVSETLKDGWTNVGPISIDVTLDEESAEGVDFTNAPLTCISGHKFNSKTNAGLSGWTIQLKDANGAMIRETTTGTGGFYQFCGLAPGRYTVCEVLKAQWKAVSPICIDVELVECDNSEDNDFFNEPSNLVCVCPFFIKNELYNANCNAIYEVDASKGILANDPPGSIVLNPESITIDPKYGTITVEEDGSFVYDPTGATALHTGVYVIFKYAANNGFCDSKYLGVAKIQVSCK